MNRAPSPTIIGADLVVKGRIRQGGAIDVHGLVEGGIEVADLRIHAGGRVFGRVRADRIEVNGTLQGDVTAKHLINIGGSGSVRGNVRYGQLAMAPGGDLSADVRNVPPEIHGDLNVVVRRGRSVPITQADIDAVDPDDSGDDVRFTVANAVGGFVAMAEAPTAPIAGFSETDLVGGRVLFVHDGATSTGGFDVSATDKAGAASTPKRVTVTVLT